MELALTHIRWIRKQRYRRRNNGPNCNFRFPRGLNRKIGITLPCKSRFVSSAGHRRSASVPDLADSSSAAKPYLTAPPSLYLSHTFASREPSAASSVRLPPSLPMRSTRQASGCGWAWQLPWGSVVSYGSGGGGVAVYLKPPPVAWRH